MLDIYGLYKKVPGGMILIPMVLFAIINTLFPNLWTSLGDMSQALFKSGTLAFAALILFGTGASLNLKTLGETLKRGGSLAIMKLLIGFVFGFAFIHFFGLDGIWGINAVSFVACITSANPGTFMGIIQDYGEGADMGNFALLNVITTPAVPLLILSAGAGDISSSLLGIVSVLLPFVLGVILGNLDPKFSKIYGAVTPIALPFMGCCFGSSINLISAVQAGLAGVLLAVIYLILHLPMLATDKFINHRPGYCSVAMCSVAGIALVVPTMVSSLGETYAAYAESSLSQIAMCLLITNIVSPFLCRLTVKLWGCPKIPKDGASAQ